jgi:transposase, IS5 family
LCIYSEDGTTSRPRRQRRRRLNTIFGRLLRELERKLPPERLKTCRGKLEIFAKILSQERDSKNKIYSIHEPHVYCVAKGKDHKKYEFGNKVPIARTKSSGIIIGALNIETNQYGGHTLAAALRQIEELRGSRLKVVITDQGYRGRKYHWETEIVNARDLRRQKTAYRKRKVKKQLKKRNAIEPVIEHLKSGPRLSMNYLSGVVGDNINVMLAAAGYNFKRLLRKLKHFWFDFLHGVFLKTAGRIALELNF